MSEATAYLERTVPLSPAEAADEVASRTLACTTRTKSVDLEVYKKMANGEMIPVVASARRERNGLFCVATADDEEFVVQEADLYNEKKYRIKQIRLDQ